MLLLPQPPGDSHVRFSNQRLLAWQKQLSRTGLEKARRDPLETTIIRPVDPIESLHRAAGERSQGVPSTPIYLPGTYPSCTRHRLPKRTFQQELRDFDPVWNALSPREQQRVLQLLVQRVDYHGESGQVEITVERDGFDLFLEPFSEARTVA